MPAFNPNLPAANSVTDSAELRNQFNALKEGLDACALQADVEDLVYSQTAGMPAAVQPLAIAVSNPPTRAEVQAIVDKLNELLGVLQRT